MKTIKVRKLTMPRGGGLSDGQYNIEFRRMTWGETEALTRALRGAGLIALANELENAVATADTEAA